MSGLLPLVGCARRVGDDIGTEAILPARCRHGTSDPALLRRHLFEDADIGFAASIREGDILVAGRNFGGGTVTELTVTTLLSAGIRAVIAPSFARNYLRSAFNNGLLAVCAITEGIREGDAITLSDAPGGAIELRTPTLRLYCAALPQFARALIEAGGVVPYLREHGSFGPELPGERP